MIFTFFDKKREDNLDNNSNPVSSINANKNNLNNQFTQNNTKPIKLFFILSIGLIIILIASIFAVVIFNLNKQNLLKETDSGNTNTEEGLNGSSETSENTEIGSPAIDNSNNGGGGSGDNDNSNGNEQQNIVLMGFFKDFLFSNRPSLSPGRQDIYYKAGNVGIGTDAPNYTLQISNDAGDIMLGIVNSSSYNSTAPWNVLRHAINVKGSANPDLYFRNGGSTANGANIISGFPLRIATLQPDKDISFGYGINYNSPGQTSLTNTTMYLDMGTGNVGIGTANPTSRLHVVSGSGGNLQFDHEETSDFERDNLGFEYSISRLAIRAVGNEAAEILLKGEGTTAKRFGIYSTKELYLTTNTGNNISFGRGMIYTAKGDQGPQNIDLAIDGNTGDIFIDNLKGTGNAYVCVNSNGKLFRSSTACV